MQIKKKSVSIGNTNSSRHNAGEDIPKNIRSTREQLCYFLLFLIFVLVSICVDYKKADSKSDVVIPMNDGWMTEAGQYLSLDALPQGDLVISTDVGSYATDGMALCLKSIDTNFEIYADGNRIYTYHPFVPKWLGISYGMYVHTVSIPQNTTEHRLRLEPIFPDTPAGFRNVVIEEGGQYMARLFRNNLTTFNCSLLTLFIGLLFLIVGLFGKILMKYSGLDFISFGVLCTLLGFTGFNDTLLLQVLTQHPSVVRVVTYICLIFIPYPAVSFFASATGQGHSRLISGTLAACFVNFVMQFWLNYAGISDYYYLVYISHGIIIAAFGVSIYLMIRAIRLSAIHPDLLRSLVSGLSACVVGAALDMLRYYYSQSYGSSDFTRLGVLIFAVLMGAYLFHAQVRALNQKQRDNMTFIRELTEAFAKVIDMKDSYTNGHSSRVAKYTTMLARELGYDEETVEKYYRIALLHDIGKIGVPPEVLNKPGKLTDAEFETIKSHTSRGYEALKGISIMPELAIGAQSHHERPDGRGYPDHLKGDEIPRVAQIIAVADCFDAMYSDRPYRKRMNFDKAVSIIKEVSGTQLTPDVVDAFFRLVEKGELRAPDDHGGGSLENIENIRGEIKK